MTTTARQMHGSRKQGVEVRLLTRLGARLIDALLLAGLGVAMGGVIGFGVGWLVLQAVAVFAYFVLLDSIAGTTPGKRVLGLKVAGPSGSNPTVQQAARREAFTLLGAVPFVGPPLAAIAWAVIIVTVHGSPTGQGIHDRLAAGTRVVSA